MQPIDTSPDASPERQHLPHRLAGIHPHGGPNQGALADRLDRIVGIVCAALLVSVLVATLAGWLE